MQFSEALINDYIFLKPEIESLQNDNWMRANKYWEKILTNTMHLGSNSKVLLKRMQKTEFSIAIDFQKCQSLSKEDLKELLQTFVPGSITKSQSRKIDSLLKAVDTIGNCGGIDSFLKINQDRTELLDHLMQFDGIGCKAARNIFMDLYHPKFRYGTIPIDKNWTKVGKFLNQRWTDPCKHENSILEWRKKYIHSDCIKEDWTFDRAVYQALNHKNSNVNKLLELNPNDV